MTSAPACSASLTSSSVSVSTSILAVWGAKSRAIFTAFDKEPAAVMWFSLINTCSLNEARWLKQPPQRTAYFSSARQPGVVLRVSTIRTPVPVACAASAKRREMLAIPDRRCRKFKAVRSAINNEIVGPSATRMVLPSLTRSPSLTLRSTFSAGSTRLNTSLAISRPQITMSSRATMRAFER